MIGWRLQARLRWRARLRVLVPEIRRARLAEAATPGHIIRCGYDGDWVEDSRGQPVRMQNKDEREAWIMMLHNARRRRARGRPLALRSTRERRIIL